jgi:hypothetical protein
MIHLNVTFDSTLVRQLRDAGWGGMDAAWSDFCRRYLLTDVGGVRELFQRDRKVSPSEMRLLDDTLAFVSLNLQKSIEHINRWLPEVDDDISHEVTVAFLPYGNYTFSPKPSLQLFSLDPSASPIEAYLFLVHVYYHELSHLNETAKGRRCSIEQLSAEDFREWVRLLIRNEGIGNYAVLDDLIQFRDTHSDYSFRYFSYAKKIRDPVLLQGAVRILTRVFTEVDDNNVAHFRDGINKIFKNEGLPIINLIGIHMAESIVRNKDAATLKNVYQKEAGDFFALYGQTGAEFAETLKGL